jgi:NDP-sugar pyrophosphorylase family protein
MHILIPMSGAGRRFAEMGYAKPKPLIEFFGKPMIEHVLKNLGSDNKYTLCVLKDHYDADQTVFNRLKNQVDKLNIVVIDKITQGAAETCLLAKQHIDPESPLMIANCDQLMSWNQKAFENYMVKDMLDGAMFVFNSDSAKNSYVEVDSNNLAVRTAEKQVISPYATTGIYVWDKGIDFVWAAERMIAKNLRANNEFYVAPVYNENIARGDRIGIWSPDEHWPIGTPEDLEIYIKAHQHENL